MRSSDYECLSEMGQGWAGVTWRAELRVAKFELPAGALVAVKIYKPEIFHLAPNIRVRIEREARTGLAIRHPNVMRVFALEEIDIEPIGPRLVLIMQFCPGGDLSRRLESGGTLPGDAWSIARGLLDGVHALHDARTIHRDIKPQNILFREGDVPCIADFGVIRQVHEMTMTGSAEFLGTIRYAPPEVLDGGEATFAGDIYSLGTVLYELIYGKPVFDGAQLFSKLIVQITTKPIELPVGPDRFAAQASPMATVLESFCRRMLLPEPPARPDAATLASWYDAGIAAPPFREDLREALFTVLRANEQRWFQEDRKDSSIFTDFRAAVLLAEMTHEDALVLMRDRSPAAIESNPTYRAMATMYLPEGEAYLALAPELRLALAYSLQANHRRVVDMIWDEWTTRVNFDFRYVAMAEGYRDLEPDPEIKSAMAEVRRLLPNERSDWS